MTRQRRDESRKRGISFSHSDLVSFGVLIVFVGATWWVRSWLKEGPPDYFHTGDLRRYYLPLYEVTFGWMAGGRLPVWNPYHLTGVPWLATLQTGVFYPPHLLYLVLPIHTGFVLSTVFHLLLAAGGTFAVARALGLRSAAALVAGMLFPMRGSMQIWLQYPSALEAAAWLPLGCLGVLALTNREPRSAVRILALATGMSLLAGYPQATLYSIYTWGILFVFLEFGIRPRPAAFLHAGALFGSGVAIGFMLSAIQLLPTLALLQEGTRATEVLAAEKTMLFAIRNFFSLKSAVTGGGLTSFGVISLCLAPLALLVRGRRSVTLCLATLAAVTYLGAGGAGEFHPEIYRALPGLSWFRYPIRMLFVTHFCVAVLVAIGIDTLLRAGARENACTAAAGKKSGILRERGTPLVLLILSIGFAIRLAGLDYPNWALVALTLAAAAILVAFGWHRVAAVLVVALAGVDLWLAPTRVGPLPYREDESVYHANAPAFRRLAELAGSERVVWFQAAPRRGLKLAAASRLRALEDYEPMGLRRHSEYFEFLKTGRSEKPGRGFFSGRVLPEFVFTEPGSPMARAALVTRRRLLDLVGARVFVAPPAGIRNPSLRELIAAAGLRELPAEPGLSVYVNDAVVPRAFVTYRTLPAPAVDALLAALARPDFDPMAASYVEGDAGFMWDARSPARGAAAAILIDDPTRVVVAAELAAPGLVVLGDSFTTAWAARVDGRPAPILATNHLFRGVAVPAGVHRIEFVYEPWSLWIGAGCSLVAIGALVIPVRKRRHSAGVSPSRNASGAIPPSGPRRQR